jgi:small subunit ribosomal protein S21
MKKTKQPVINKSTIPAEIDFDKLFSPIQVVVLNDNFDRALKIFRSLVQSERILSLFKEKSRYEKPSEKKHRKQNEAKRRMFEEDMKQKKIASGEYEKDLLKRQIKKEKKKLLRESKNSE